MLLPTIEKVLPVPPLLFSKILTELSIWNFRDKRYENFNFYFKKHYVKGYKVNELSKSSNTEIPSFLNETVGWIQSIIGDHYIPAQAMLNLIMPNQRFPIHIDSFRFHQVARRYHICLDNSEIEYHFYVNDKIITEYMNTGNLYFFNNLVPHGVSNSSLKSRTNLILDMIPKYTDIKSLSDAIPEILQESQNLQQKFYKDKELSKFIKCSID
jgi:hypothetical protein